MTDIRMTPGGSMEAIGSGGSWQSVPKAAQQEIERLRKRLMEAEIQTFPNEVHIWNDAVAACQKAALDEVDAIEREAADGMPNPARCIVRTMNRLRKDGDDRRIDLVTSLTAGDFPEPK